MIINLLNNGKDPLKITDFIFEGKMMPEEIKEISGSHLSYAIIPF